MDNRVAYDRLHKYPDIDRSTELFEPSWFHPGQLVNLHVSFRLMVNSAKQHVQNRVIIRDMMNFLYTAFYREPRHLPSFVHKLVILSYIIGFGNEHKFTMHKSCYSNLNPEALRFHLKSVPWETMRQNLTLVSESTQDMNQPLYGGMQTKCCARISTGHPQLRALEQELQRCRQEWIASGGSIELDPPACIKEEKGRGILVVLLHKDDLSSSTLMLAVDIQSSDVTKGGWLTILETGPCSHD
ncbi:hypothetical protein ARMGADRAFT_1039194 [Armillaria gallica]|uniref:Uncharacterized protein n=1 Tax=Armillaria gallica TaxID=47427 RepID=A0A2H3CT45_ARMGA|nr:hypothetical protein ARMGADRAFT_1039194 [Armillaria gallica]